ncbi:transglutaminase domain-containing protein [Agromyces sp. MMS24-JH15]|uniref:transglutaminase domain-containing protein n=1 Tax=Agromyces sp. MMS24-JH15 TaxID=3243765 RepID=UPI003749636A
MTRAERAAGRRRAPRRAGEETGIALVGFGYLVAGAAIAAWSAWPLHGTWRVWLVLGAGVLVGTGAALLGRRAGGLLGACTTVLLAIAGYLLVVVPVAVPSALGDVDHLLRGIRDGLTGTVLGWKQVLTVEPPLGDYQAVLVPLLVVAVVASTVAASLIARGGRAAPVAALPVMAMAVYGIAFGTAAEGASWQLGPLAVPGGREVAIGVASLALGAGWLLLRSRMRRARALARARAGTVRQGAASTWITVRRNAVAVSLLVVALVAGVAAVPAVGSVAERSVLRDAVEPSIVVQRQPSPLSDYRSWFRASTLDEPVIEVSGDLDAFDRIAFATLDEYSGEVFHVDPDTRYTRLVRGDAGGDDLAALHVEIGDAYSGLWVPAPEGLAAAPAFEGGRAEQLADGFHAAATGSAIEIAGTGDAMGLRPGDAYRLVAERADASADADAAFASAPGSDNGLDPETYPSLTAWLELQEVPRTGAGYLDLVDRLRARGYLSHSVLADDASANWIAALGAQGGYSFEPSYAGHSRARIEELFAELVDQQRLAGADPPDAALVAAVGDDEQFAVAAALLARALGFDSRVVLGMRLPGADPVPGIPSCDGTCTGASMTAWAEVRAAGGDWIAVDASPQFTAAPSPIIAGVQLPEHPTVPDDERSEPIEPPRAESESTDAAAPPAVVDAAGPPAWLGAVRWAAIGAGALVLALLPLVALFAARAMRRRSRRGSGDPELRVVSAWEELQDLYVEAGVAMPPTGSRAVAAAATGRPAAAELARLVDLAVFAPHPPAPEVADAAWAIVDDERARLRGALGPVARLRTSLTLRAAVERLRPRPGSGPGPARPKEITP